jgi:hypothetical protein
LPFAWLCQQVRIHSYSLHPPTLGNPANAIASSFSS